MMFFMRRRKRALEKQMAELALRKKESELRWSELQKDSRRPRQAQSVWGSDEDLVRPIVEDTGIVKKPQLLDISKAMNTKEREQRGVDRMKATTPEALRGLRDLIRAKYQLDIEIWSLRGARGPDRPLIMAKMEKADAMLIELHTIVNSWVENDRIWTSDEWRLAQFIKERVQAEGKRWWQNNPPWNDNWTFPTTSATPLPRSPSTSLPTAQTSRENLQMQRKISINPIVGNIPPKPDSSELMKDIVIGPLEHTLSYDAFIKSHQEPVTPKGSNRLVIAIDYGTTFTGVAFATPKSKFADLEDIEIVTNWGLQMGNHHKIPSVYSYSPASIAGEQQWGASLSAEAVTMVNTKMELDVQDNKADELELIQQLLHGTNSLEFEAVKRSGGFPEYTWKNPEAIVTDYMTKVFQHLNQSSEYFDPRIRAQLQVDLVITVPVKWSYRAKNSTLRAIKRAGFNEATFPNLNDIIMVTEPEAAAIYTARYLKEARKMDFLKLNECFILCDAGGGTVDCVSYKVTQLEPALELEEMTIATSSKCGSTFIDLNFKKWLQKILGNEYYRALDPKGVGHQMSAHSTEGRKMREVIKKFEARKKAFYKDAHDIYLDLPYGSLHNLVIPSKLREGELKITNAEMKSFFDPCVDDVVELIQGQIQQVERLKSRVKNVFLVGGFGESSYLQEELKDSLELRRITMRRPDSAKAWTAVVQGAVIYGIEKSNHNNFTLVSTCSRSYGVALDNAYSCDKCSHCRCQYTGTITGKGAHHKMAEQPLTWLIRRGDLMLSDHTKITEKSFEFHFHETDDRIFSLPIYEYPYDDDDVPESFETAGFDELVKAAVMNCDISHIPLGDFDQLHPPSYIGGQHYVAKLALKIILSKSSFDFGVYWNQSRLCSTEITVLAASSITGSKLDPSLCDKDSCAQSHYNPATDSDNRDSPSSYIRKPPKATGPVGRAEIASGIGPQRQVESGSTWNDGSLALRSIDDYSNNAMAMLTAEKTIETKTCSRSSVESQEADLSLSLRIHHSDEHMEESSSVEAAGSDDYFIAESDETELVETETCSTVDEPDSHHPILSIKAREFTELTLVKFWDVFNRDREKLYRQRAPANRQTASSTTTRQPTAYHTGSSCNTVMTGITPQLCGISRPRSEEDDDDGRVPKRGRIATEVPTDKRESCRFACPYRKYNRQQYNIHTHRTCALSWFPTIARVKEHLYRTHRAPIQCPRCSLEFHDQQALKTHLKATFMCENTEARPVEGFDLDVEAKLKRRTVRSRDQSASGRWEEIYCLLFPGECVPCPFFEPPQDEPPPPTIQIEEFIRQDVPRLVREQVENTFASSNDLALTRSIISAAIVELVEQAIDTSILTFNNTKSEQSDSHIDLDANQPSTSNLSTASNPQGPVLQQQTNSTSEVLRELSRTSLPVSRGWQGSVPVLVPTLSSSAGQSTPDTIDALSFDMSTDGVEPTSEASQRHNSFGNHIPQEVTAPVLALNTGDQMSVSLKNSKRQPDVGHDQDLSLSDPGNHLNSTARSSFELSMNMEISPGEFVFNELGSDWNWLTEVDPEQNLVNG